MDTRRKRILIVDTDPETLIAIEQVLEDQGFETTTTWDVGQGIKLLGSGAFDLLLVGNHPPEIDIARIVRQVQQTGDTARCLVLQSTARFPFETEYLCHKGAHAVVGRWEYALIARKVHECLQASDQERANARRAAA